MDILAKECLTCGKSFTRNVRPSGQVERPCMFRRRKFCSVACMSKSHIKPVKTVFCVVCGSEIPRRTYPGGQHQQWCYYVKQRYCGFQCAGSDRRKEDPTRAAWQWRARRLKLKNCQRCGSTKRLCLHHIDRNWKNNEPHNIETLCASCHMKEHIHAGEIISPRTQYGWNKK